MDKKNLLNEIVKPRESIKRKHLALKLGKDSLQQAVNETLKPIIDPLEMIANAPPPPPPTALDISNNTTMAFQTPRKFSRNTFHSVIGEDTSFKQLQVTSSPKPGSPNPAENYLQLLRTQKLENLDTKLVVRKMTVPLKRKTAAAVATAFKSILAKGRKPKNLHVDQGTKFYNKECKDLFKKYKIKLYSTFSGLKATIIERFNRTIKTKMWKMFSLRGNFTTSCKI